MIRASAAAAIAVGGACAAARAFVGSASPGAAAQGAREAASLRGVGSAPAPAATGTAPGGLQSALAGSAAAALVAASVKAARRSRPSRRAQGQEVVEAIPRPEDLLESPKFPLYAGSSGGYMSKATRERHAITWTAKEEMFVELPTGGMAMMNKGENLCYFRKKEQCIALGKLLRQLKIDNYKVYRVAKDGTVTFMHPADGVFPEKVNKGRVQVNGRPFTVGQNPRPGTLKWTKYHQKGYEADALTTLFVKARCRAFEDLENLFPLPNISQWAEIDDPETTESYQNYFKSL